MHQYVCPSPNNVRAADNDSDSDSNSKEMVEIKLNNRVMRMQVDSGCKKVLIHEDNFKQLSRTA